MSNNFFDEENEPFQDIPEEVSGQSSSVPIINQPRRTTTNTYSPPPAAEEAYQAEILTEDEEDYSEILSQARFKLELGGLYEMLMNHDIFSGAQADEKSIKYITKQIRNFAKEQMEIMLGMRQEAKVAQNIVSSPFNDLEVRTLKALASTATKGATSAPQAQTVSAQPVGLNKIVAKPQPKPLTPVAATKTVSAPAPNKPLAQRTQAPMQRAKVSPAIEQILREEGLTIEQYEAATKSSLTKPLHEMTEDELIKRNAQNKTRRATNPQALPTPSYAQEQMLATEMAINGMSDPKMAGIMNILNQQTKK